MSTDSLPLLFQTPDDWAAGPLADIPALLSDHAYLERKAASNALDLWNRWPDADRADAWVARLTGIARDEALHLSQVSGLVRQRGGRLQRLHQSRYASDLRGLVRAGHGPDELIDRLLVSALIEARSCERFEILSRACPEAGLASFYRSLYASEKGHHRLFLDLAADVAPEETVAPRWRYLLSREAEIIMAQPVGPGLHSGVPTARADTHLLWDSTTNSNRM